MSILKKQDYAQIRAALGVNISRSMLPDRIIEMDIHLGAAEAWLLKLDPDAAIRDDCSASVRKAIIYKTASLLIDAIPDLTRESFAKGEGFTKEKRDPYLGSKLSRRAQDEVNAYLDPNGEAAAAAASTHFTSGCAEGGL